MYEASIFILSIIAWQTQRRAQCGLEYFSFTDISEWMNERTNERTGLCKVRIGRQKLILGDFRKHLKLISSHRDFIMCIVSLAIFHPHFVIRILSSAIFHPPSAAIRSALYRDPERTNAVCVWDKVDNWPLLSFVNIKYSPSLFFRFCRWPAFLLFSRREVWWPFTWNNMAEWQLWETMPKFIIIIHHRVDVLHLRKFICQGS